VLRLLAVAVDGAMVLLQSPALRMQLRDGRVVVGVLCAERCRCAQQCSARGLWCWVLIGGRVEVVVAKAGLDCGTVWPVHMYYTYMLVQFAPVGSARAKCARKCLYALRLCEESSLLQDRSAWPLPVLTVVAVSCGEMPAGRGCVAVA